MDTDFFTDKKIKLLKGEFGVWGLVIVIAAFSRIYSTNGYYASFDEDDAILLADELGAGCTPQLVREVVQGCVKRSIFDEGVFNVFGVLTSPGIQRRYIRAVSKRDDITLIDEYWLLNLDNPEDVPKAMRVKVTFKTVSGEFKPVSGGRNPFHSSDNPQSKGKERKGKESNVVKPDDDLTDYLEQNLWRMSAGNYSDLRELMADGIPEELVRHAVDCATERGKPSWGYVRSILNRWLVEGVRTVGEARAAHARFVQKAAREGQPPQRPVSPTIDELGGSGSLYK